MTIKENYTELLYRAIASGDDDLRALGERFEIYRFTYWNGEYFDADGLRLFRVYEKVGYDN